MKVLLDTNIILDYALKRNEFVENARKIIKMAYFKKINAYITASSVTDIYYIVKKIENKQNAIEFLQTILNFIDVANVNKEIILNAISCSSIIDFEDSVQISSAVYNELEIIVTRNQKHFIYSKIPVYPPDEFLNLIENKQL